MCREPDDRPPTTDELGALKAGFAMVVLAVALTIIHAEIIASAIDRQSQKCIPAEYP